jgi:hypothetical protein
LKKNSHIWVICLDKNIEHSFKLGEEKKITVGNNTDDKSIANIVCKKKK